MARRISDETINAYIDGELNREERNQIDHAIQNDPELCAEVKNRYELKQSVISNYGSLSPRDDELVSHTSRTSRYVASFVFILFGTLIGWLGHGSLTSQQATYQVSNIAGYTLQPVDFTQPNKVVLHISSGTTEDMRKALDTMHEITQKQKQNHQNYKIEIVANSDGIDLLRESVSPYKNELLDVMKNDNNVSFIACVNTIERLQLRGDSIAMIGNTHTDGTAIDKIISRLQQGWMYIKV